MLAIMSEGVKRERRAYGPEGAEDEAEALAKQLEQCDNSKIETRQEQRSTEALARQKTIDEFTQRSEVLKKEIAELEEIVNSALRTKSTPVRWKERLRACYRRKKANCIS